MATLFIKLDTKAYTWNGTTLTQVSDVDYPATTVRGALYLNKIFYVMDTAGVIWGSAEDDPTSWNALNFVKASFAPDEGVCLAQALEYIVAFGRYTTEAFYDAGLAPPASALSPVQSGIMLVGCAHGNSVAQSETALVWMALQKAQGSTYHKGRFIAMMDGFGAYKRISTPDVERLLDADDLAGVFADILTIAGHAFYVLTLSTTAITLVADLRTGLWYEWNISTAGSAKSVSSLTQSNGLATATSTAHGFSDGDYVVVAGATPSGYNLTVNVNVVDANTFTYPVSSSLSTPATGTITATSWTTGAFDLAQTLFFNGNQVLQTRGSGKIYSLSLTGTTDNGAPIDMRVRTPNFDKDTADPKGMPWLELVASQAASEDNILVRVTDDDYQTWSSFRRLDLAQKRKRLWRLGQYFRRAVELRHTASSRPRVEYIDVP